MAQVYAKAYQKKVDERFSIKLLTEPGVNQDYDWAGVKTIGVYGIDTVPLGNYTRSGTSRYGAVVELGNTNQELTLARDRAFTFSIDKGNFTETQMVAESGKALARELDEVAMPEIDVWRLSVMNAAATANGKSTIVTPGATTKDNAYDNFLALGSSLSDDLVPLGGRVAFMTSAYYAKLKNSGFVLASEDFAGSRHSGNLGTVDGVRVIVVPSSYMPASVDLIMTHPVATVGPRKIEDYKTHDNPPGINGKLVEGRLIYDAFVLNNKIDAIAVHRTAA